MRGTETGWRNGLMGALNFRTGKYKVLHLGWNSPMQQDGLRAGCMERGFAEKDLRLLVDYSNMPLLQSQLHPGLYEQEVN